MTALAVVGGAVVHGDGVEEADVLASDGRIDRVGPALPLPAGAEVLDATGLLVAPGFLDLQLNGGHGIDLAAEPERLGELAAILPRYGVTAFLPTIVTSPAGTVDRALGALAATAPRTTFTGAEPLGLHLEGPMLNPARRGAHTADLLRMPSPDLVAGWTRERGVGMVTLAPELPGAIDLVRQLADAGVVVALGHSEATAEEALAAVSAGARYVTHLHNAMAPFGHRQPGLAGVAMVDERLTVGLIADGIHVHPVAVRAAWKAVGGRLNLVTDAVAALGQPSGTYSLGRGRITVTEQEVRLEDGTLAGSALSLDRAVRNLVDFAGCTRHEAIATVTTTPATLLGLTRKGRVAAGADADVVLLTPDLHVVATVIGGHIVHRAEDVAWRS